MVRWAYLVVKLGKRPWFGSWVRKSFWRRDGLPTPVFLGFPGGSVGKESACNVGDLVRSLGWDDPQKGKATHSSILAGEFHGLYSPRGCKELDTTERLAVSSFINYFAHIRMIFY